MTTMIHNTAICDCEMCGWVAKREQAAARVTEKDRIAGARRYALAEIDRLQRDIDAMDARHDAIEDEEMGR